MTLLWYYAVYSEKGQRHTIRIAGTFLVLAGIVTGVYGSRVSYAQFHYHRLKFRAPDLVLSEAAGQADRLHRMYPHNYHLSHWLAEKAWFVNNDRERAGHWVRLGLEQNPDLRELRWLEVILLGLVSPPAAAARWAEYHDVVFWNRWVMAGRVYWHAMAGEFLEAEHYLAFLGKVGGRDLVWATEALAAARSYYGP